MEETKGQNKRRRSTKDAPEMRVVGIDFNPGPDAEERLRRVYDLILRKTLDSPPRKLDNGR